MPKTIAVHRFPARIECRYLVQEPETVDDSVSVFALHGYGMDAETMLRLSSLWFPENRITSIQAPHPFYSSMEKREVGYSWATHMQSEESVDLHHAMLLHVLEQSGVPPERRLLLGFSQPVGLNYRFAATHPTEVRGVIGVCGGVPKDWESGDYKPVSAALLHIARTEDEVYSSQVARHFEERLRVRAADVEYREFPGPHRFPSLARPAVAEWVRSRFPESP